jgi:hypothetical protein
MTGSLPHRQQRIEISVVGLYNRRCKERISTCRTKLGILGDLCGSSEPR